jgi:hypothetical protein
VFQNVSPSREGDRGGLHFRSDIEAGTALGKAVADAVIARATADSSLVAAN